MSPHDTPSNDHDPNETSCLANLVMHAGSKEERDRAMMRLDPVIRQIACQITTNLRPPDWRQELIDEAPSIVWEKLRSGAYDTSKGKFEAWCRTVLKNRHIDQTRRRQRQGDHLRGAQAIDPEQGIDPPDPRPSWNTDLERTEPLGAADLQRVERWNAFDRVFLLCMAGLWPRVPDTTWRRWLDACDLDEPFPPEGFMELDDLSPRYAMLAEALNLKRNRLVQRLRRGKHRLLGLDAVTSGKEKTP